MTDATGPSSGRATSAGKKARDGPQTSNAADHGHHDRTAPRCPFEFAGFGPSGRPYERHHVSEAHGPTKRQHKKGKQIIAEHERKVIRSNSSLFVTLRTQGLGMPVPINKYG